MFSTFPTEMDDPLLLMESSPGSLQLIVDTWLARKGGPEKVALLERWSRVLSGEEGVDTLAELLTRIPERTPDALVARNTRQVHQALEEVSSPTREILVRHVRDSTLGMARWAERGPRIETEEDLDDYMHEVAGRVGWLLTEVFSLHVPQLASRKEEMMHLGREFGLALQTVNVIRGLHGDWERGWVFIPRAFVPGEIDPHTLFTPGGRDRSTEVAILERLVPKAERHLEAAQRYIARIPRSEKGIRLFCLLPYLFAVRTLAISRKNPLVFDEETKITRPEVRRIVFWSRIFGGSDRWVHWYAERLAR